MTEYAFILALIFAVVIVTVPMIGTAINAFFTTLTSAF
jgi:Flp pilus assembly pilin Flp